MKINKMPDLLKERLEVLWLLKTTSLSLNQIEKKVSFEKERVKNHISTLLKLNMIKQEEENYKIKETCIEKVNNMLLNIKYMA